MRLKQVVYLFPAANPSFFAVLAQLFGESEGCTVSGNEIRFGTRGKLPETVLRLADVPFPVVQLDLPSPMELVLQTDQTVLQRSDPADGDFVQLPPDSEDYTALLPIEKACERLKGHVLRLDHTGVNIPTGLWDRQRWEGLLQIVAAAANIYRYPTGEDWPFVIPATQAEFETDITEAEPMRRPKFELVYDSYIRRPLLQFDMETDLTREEVESRFPPPYGVGLTGLDQFFRSVYVYHPWPGLSIRFDLGYRYDPPGDMAGWLIREGGRITG